MSVSEQRSGSILAVDFGNVQTRALLIDLVDGLYQLVARGETRTTAGFPANDARLGLNRVVEQITAVTGRKLLTNDGKVISPEQNDRSGVDYFVTTASTGTRDGEMRPQACPIPASAGGALPRLGRSVVSAMDASSSRFWEVLVHLPLSAF